MTGAQPARVDVSACDSEPIHIPGSIQPFGVLFNLHPESCAVVQVSRNTKEMLGLSPEKILGWSIADVLGIDNAEGLLPILRNLPIGGTPVYLRQVPWPPAGNSFHLVAHRLPSALILELERSQTSAQPFFASVLPLLLQFADRLRVIQSPEQAADIAVREIRRLTGFDRVLVYQFDSDWNGQVIAESRASDVSSYLNLWFPASDIPQQARRLYALNRIRMIADVSYQPVPLEPSQNPLARQPLDLSFSILRSVSPIHLEYLRNMNVSSSMSISLIASDQRLWGLIGCHHHSSKLIPFDVRLACDLMSRMLVANFEMSEREANLERQVNLRSIVTRLLASTAQQPDLLQALAGHPKELLSLASATGTAIFQGGSCACLGFCPSQDQIARTVAWLAQNSRSEIFQTDRAAKIFPDGDALLQHAAGILALFVSQTFDTCILWFRPECVRTLNWAGDPTKLPASPQQPDRLHPRKSFETWLESVRGTSLKWSPIEVEAVSLLRSGLELSLSAAEMTRSKNELEAFSYSVSHDLRAPFRHIGSYAEIVLSSPTANFSQEEKHYLQNVIDVAQNAGTVLDSLLAFSRLGRVAIHPRNVDMAALVEELRLELVREMRDRQIVWRISPLPEVFADPLMLRLALQNLLDNALKYTRTRPQAIVDVVHQEGKGEDIFFVRDNGVGFDQAYVGQLFGVFHRLHRVEEFEGTGIGLANVRAMIGRHGGRTWAEGAIDKGATFYFSLPRRHTTGESNA